MGICQRVSEGVSVMGNIIFAVYGSSGNLLGLVDFMEAAQELRNLNPGSSLEYIIRNKEK